MGFTIPQIDDILEPYCKKSYDKYIKDYLDVAVATEGVYKFSQADKYAKDKVRRDLEQGFQGLEIKLNTVACSRGDYPSNVGGFGW